MNPQFELRFLIAVVTALALITSGSSQARADVGPRVEIKMPADTKPAISGSVYSGVFEIRVFRPGSVSDIQIAGEGWTILAVEIPEGIATAAAGTIRIPFKAVPTDANKPIGLTLNYDGRRVTKRYSVGPDYFERVSKGFPSISRPGTTGLRPGSTAAAGDDCRCSIGGLHLVRGFGRIVFTRPDGKRVGADRIRVELRDNDTIGHDLIWAGYTDQNGYFDTDCRDGDVDGDSNPDFILYYETNNGWVDVTDNSILESTYWSETGEIENYPFDCYDFGEITPVDSQMHNALHISNVITRARRYLDQLGGFAPGPVQVEWPVEEWTHYEPGPEEIHLKDIHEWEEGTMIHEYGHHFMYYFGNPPNTDYCNGYCDPDPPDDCGHCAWCPENDHDAFNEGFPNWMADVITRSFAETYEFSPGVPYEPFVEDRPVNTESPRLCEDGTFGDAITTEGFVSLLLRDIEDETQDDHDDDPDNDVVLRDGISDIMCLGAQPIFQTFVINTPTTVLQFISAFRNRYPDETGDLWATAYNVGGPDYVVGFPPDTQRPGPVMVCDSPTHPIGVGAADSCLTIEWDPATDDATGANVYSYFFHQNPAGIEPDEDEDLIRLTDHCLLSAPATAWELGDWYFSIKARDNSGNWANDWRTFGPFGILDCNNTGLLDICDISCDHTGVPNGGICEFALSPCTGREGCGLSSDCNTNLRPDECDIASGESEDCNADGIPDECQSMKHWSGEIDNDWGKAGNWLENQIPQTDDHVCIESKSPVQVSYRLPSATLSTLSSHENVLITGNFPPWPTMTLNDSSFINGEFTFAGGSSSLTVNDSLTLNGLFRWNGGILRGTGVTDVRGGIALTTAGVHLQSQDLRISQGTAVSQGGQILLASSALVVIEPGITYQYNGASGNIFGGGSSDLVHNAGTIVRSSGTGRASLAVPLTNVETIRVQTGELNLGRLSSHTGQLLGDPGTIISFTGLGSDNHSLLPGSNFDVSSVKFFSGSGDFRGRVNIADTIESSGGIYRFQPEADIVSYGNHLSVTGTPTGSSGTVHFKAPTDRPISFGTVSMTGGNQQIHFETGQEVHIQDFMLSSGIVHGNSPIIIDGTLTWTTGGFWTSGDVTANGPIVLQGSSSESRTLLRPLYNTQSATMYTGSIAMSGGNAGWNNLPGSTFRIQANSVGISGGALTNAGSLIRASGTGIATISSSITNTGLIHNQTGTLALGGTSAYSGTVRSDPGATLRMGGGTHTFQASSSLAAETLDLSLSSGTVQGTVEITDAILCNGCNWTFAANAAILDYGHDVSITGGTLRFDAPTNRAVDLDSVTVGPTVSGGNTFYAHTGQPFNIGVLTLDANSQIFGNSPINVIDQFVWRNGNMFSGGAITILGSSVIHPTSSSRSTSRHMHNHGNFVMLGTFSLSGGATFTNHLDGVLDFKSDSASLGSGPINNAGFFVKSGGTGQSNVNGATWTNTGTVEIQTGSIGMHTTQFTQLAGQTILNGGDLRIVFGSSPIIINGGEITGVNTVFGNLVNNGGTTAPGLPTGQLTVSGNYTQGTNATLDIEIRGTNPGEWDNLHISGTASLSGALHVSELNGFTPQVGDSFVILSATSVVGTLVPSSVPPHYEVLYSPTAVTLRARGSSFDLNGDGNIDLKDFQLFQACFSGQGMPKLPGCAGTGDPDFDVDGDVDLVDFEALRLAIGG